MPRFLIVIALLAAAYMVFPRPKPNWKAMLAPHPPTQSTANLPSAWKHGQFTILPQARYQVTAVVLSKHAYWGGDDDKLAPFDLALGWSSMSDAAVINKLNITQSNRWYYYSWTQSPPIDPADIIRMSANTHIIPADQYILDMIKRVRQYDVVELSGYLVNVDDPKVQRLWATSLTRNDTGTGSCELFWVTGARIKKPAQT